MRRMGRRCLRARRGIGGTCTRSNNPRVAASFPRFCGERFDNYEIIEYIYKCACILIASLIYLLIRGSEIFLEWKKFSVHFVGIGRRLESLNSGKIMVEIY